MMPVWISYEVALAIHDAQLADHGGGTGIGDETLLQSAMARPENLFAYGSPDTASLAASYAFGIAKNHPFVDGNKRTAFVICELFLRLNGYVLTASDIDCVKTFLALAAGDLTEDELAAWIRDRSQPRI